MESIAKTLRLLSDPTRIRLLTLLEEEELSVVELQEILAMGQSRISTQLIQLKNARLVTDRRSGKHSIYGWREPQRNETAEVLRTLRGVVQLAAAEIPEVERDRKALELVLKKRHDVTRAYFDRLAGKFGRHYCPGRSWKGLAEMLLKIMPPQVIADLGAGEGTFSQLLAQQAEQVIAIDNSPKMVEFGTKLALEHGHDNLDYRLGDLMDPPIEPGTIDLAFLSQALHHAPKPQKAVSAAFSILKPGGRIVILDLLKHQFEEAKELYADLWLGFAEIEILEFLETAGFEEPDIAIVHRETETPHFQTLLAIARRPMA
ncbi:MAG: metalloregulator ArsR/SmtB family transcription factor [Verrucomicrobiota bacterium]